MVFDEHEEKRKFWKLIFEKNNFRHYCQFDAMALITVVKEFFSS